jgi:hypothetical protein
MLSATSCIPHPVNAEIDRVAPSTVFVVGGPIALDDHVMARTECPVAVATPNESPRAIIETGGVTFSGAGRGWGVEIGFHDANGNAISMGAQSDQSAPESNGEPFVHANFVNATDVGLGTGFHHKYGPLSMPAGETHLWQINYYPDARQAAFFYDGVAVLTAPIAMSGRVFFRVQVTGAENGVHIDATFLNVNIEGGIPGGNGRTDHVEPNGTWNTSDFDFWGLDMTQTNPPEVFGADFHGSGTVRGLPTGQDWNSIETQFPGKPVAGAGVIAEYWFGQ